MFIEKLVLKNFKKFEDAELPFNQDVNILVGDNESGKSTVLEAIEICTSLQYRGRALAQELTTDLFSKSCIDAYLAGDKAQDKLPEILIEAYLTGCPDHRGNKNHEGRDAEGVFVRIFFNEELASSYAEFISEPDRVSTLPIEFYSIEWYSFAWNRLTTFNKQISTLFIDPTRLHPTFGRARYINNILTAALDDASRATLNLNYRQLKATFDDVPEVIAVNNDLDTNNQISNKNLKITADTTSTASWESSLQLTADEIAFGHVGKGEQGQIQIKLALANKSNGVDIVMVEEPENHLSHINLVQLVDFIESQNAGRQIFLTTHSSYVLNKLSIDKLCLLGDGYVRLHEVDKSTVRVVKRLPGYDTLRVVLASKVILVEGPSDELVVKKAYLREHDCLPEENGIDVVVVRGIGFSHYLNIASQLQKVVHVIKDNDKDHQTNIVDWASQYSEYECIRCFSPVDNAEYSLEPALIRANAANDNQMNQFASIAFSPQTFKTFLEQANQADKIAFFDNWFADPKAGGKKVDSAVRLFESEADFVVPTYIKQAINFD